MTEPQTEISDEKIPKKEKTPGSGNDKEKQKVTVFYMVRTVDIPVTTAVRSNVLLRKLKIPGAKRNLRRKRSSIPC